MTVDTRPNTKQMSAPEREAMNNPAGVPREIAIPSGSRREGCGEDSGRGGCINESPCFCQREGIGPWKGADERTPDTAPAPEPRCTRCNGLAEFHQDEGVWRHAGEPHQEGFLEQSFCDRYGYPIEVTDGTNPLAGDAARLASGDSNDGTVPTKSDEGESGTHSSSLTVKPFSRSRQNGPKVLQSAPSLHAEAAKQPEPPVSAQELREWAAECESDMAPKRAEKLRKLADWLPAPPDLERRRE